MGSWTSSLRTAHSTTTRPRFRRLRLVSVLYGRGRRSGSGVLKNSRSTDRAIWVAPWSIAMGDVTGDDKLDVVTGNLEAKSVSVLVNQRAPEP